MKSFATTLSLTVSLPPCPTPHITVTEQGNKRMIHKPLTNLSEAAIAATVAEAVNDILLHEPESLSEATGWEAAEGIVPTEHVFPILSRFGYEPRALHYPLNQPETPLESI